MKNVLVIIDAQNDFIDGALRNEAAIKVIPDIAEYINNFTGTLIFTQDTHDENYLNTLEGQKLPIQHCIKNTTGWYINDMLITIGVANKVGLANNNHTEESIGLPFKINRDAKKEVHIYEKETFGDIKKLPFNNDLQNADNIYICGFCTDICVISNSLILRAFYPNKKIIVLKDFCAGTSKEAHEAALTVMKSCQIDIE